MDMSYIPIAEARGFTTHLIKCPHRSWQKQQLPCLYPKRIALGILYHGFRIQSFVTLPFFPFFITKKERIRKQERK